MKLYYKLKFILFVKSQFTKADHVQINNVSARTFATLYQTDHQIKSYCTPLLSYDNVNLLANKNRVSDDVQADVFTSEKLAKNVQNVKSDVHVLVVCDFNILQYGSVSVRFSALSVSDSAYNEWLLMF